MDHFEKRLTDLKEELVLLLLRLLLLEEVETDLVLLIAEADDGDDGIFCRRDCTTSPD